MKKQHPSVAGIGAMSAVGQTARSCFDAIARGEQGIAPLRWFPVEGLRQTRAYEIGEWTAREPQYRATDLLCQAIDEALTEAGISDLTGIPVYVGTGLGEARSAERAWQASDRIGASGISLRDQLAKRLGTEDVHVFQNACSASLYALAMATDALAAGDAEAVVVAGVDVISLSMFGLLDRVQLSAPLDLAPFAGADKGVIMGEGSAAIVLTRKPVDDVVVRAVHLGCDAFHLTAPDPEGVRSCVTGAHQAAGISPQDVDVVYAHATGTQLNDMVEAEALRAVFGEEASPPLVTGVKGATGHTSGASGLFSLVMAVFSLRTGVVPGIGHHQELLPDAEALPVVRRTQGAGDLRIAQVNAFGFGGLNAVAVVEREGENR